MAEPGRTPSGTTAPIGEEPERHTGKEPVVELLRAEWASLDGLLSGLDDDEWQRPALPGWDVHDVVAHIVGTERMLSGERQPEVPPEATAVAHVRNEIARLNEAWVVDLRRRSHAELLDDFRAVTAARLAALDAMGTDDFDAPSWTPVGDATYRRFMEVRVFDCWMHEQDVRAATETPGHETGPVAEQALEEVVRALGYIVGKRAAMPDGTSVTIRLTGPLHRDLHVVVDGRARVVERPSSPPTAAIDLGSSLFLRLAGGRVEPEAAFPAVTLEGDEVLARRLASSLAYTI